MANNLNRYDLPPIRVEDSKTRTEDFVSVDQIIFLYRYTKQTTFCERRRKKFVTYP